MRNLEQLADRTTEIALAELRRRNTMSVEHTKLIACIARTLVDLAFGRVKGRYAVEAAVGVGKSTLIRALIVALSETTGHNGVLVLQERVDAGAQSVADLCDLHLLDRNTLAHVHAGSESDSKETAASRPFVFATHQRARLSSILPLLTYNGKPRAVVVDEALYSSFAIGLSLQRLTADIAWAVAFFEAERGEVESKLVEWLLALKKEIDGGLADLHATGKRDAPLSLTAPDPLLRSRFLHRVESAPGNEVQVLHQLITAANMDERFRLLLVGERSSAILQHRRVLPPELENCLIMDAGAGVDKLLALDDGIQLAHEVLPQFEGMRNPARVKDWRNVEIHRMRAPGGRSTMRDEYKANYADSAWAPKAVAEFVRDRCPTDGTILLCTYKPSNGLDYQETQRAALLRAGVVDPARVKFTHWGMHTASNAFQDSVAVIACGVWQLDRAHVTAWALGQIDNPEADVPTPEMVSDVMASWTAISMYQLAGRGAARSMDDGRTKPMIFAYIHKGSTAAKYLRNLMPGAREFDWKSPRGAKSRRQLESLTSRVAAAIRRELAFCERIGRHKITTKSLRMRVGLGDVTAKVLSDAVANVLRDGQWRKSGRTLDYIWAEPTHVHP